MNNTYHFENVKGVVIGDNNTVTIIFQNGERYVVPFLAPNRPPYKIIGRSDLLNELKRRVLEETSISLSALNGLPGVGKTALAIELAHDKEILRHFPDGVLWAGLGPKPDVLAVLSLWARSLKIALNEIPNLAKRKSWEETIHAVIGMRRMLLIIDDAWDTDSALAFRLGGPNCVHILSTRLYPVASDFAGINTIVVPELAVDDGLLLLSELAPKVVDLEPAKARELVRAVGGLPFAIVIMGNFLRQESSSGQPRRIRTALKQLHTAEQRLRLAQSQAPLEANQGLPSDIPKTLQAVIGLSYNSLKKQERRALKAISVFPPKPNTFVEAGAIAVSTVEPKALDQLTDYGLLESAGPGRYTLHQSVYDFAKARLSEKTVFNRFVAFYIDYSEQLRIDYDLLKPEIENVLASLEEAFANNLKSELLILVEKYYPLLKLMGLYLVSETHLVRAINIAKQSGDVKSLSRLLLGLGQVYDNLGEYQKSEENLRQGLEIAVSLKDEELSADFYADLANITFNRGVHDAAEKYLQDALLISRKLQNQDRISLVLLRSGRFFSEQGRRQEAIASYQEGIEIARQLNNSARLSELLTNLGVETQFTGDMNNAVILYQDSLDTARSIGYRSLISAALGNMGGIAIHRGNYTEAEVYFKEGLVVARELGHSERIMNFLQNLTALEGNRGNYAVALEYLDEGLTLARKTGNQTSIAYMLVNLGAVTGLLGNSQQADEYFREGLSLARTIENTDLIASFLYSLAESSINRNEFDSAVSYLREGLDLAERTGTAWLISYMNNGFGELHLRQDLLDLAWQNFEKAQDVAKGLNREYEAIALFGKARILEQKGDGAEACNLGRLSKDIFAEIQHYMEREVSDWLNRLKC